MPGTFSPPPRISDGDTHHGTSFEVVGGGNVPGFPQFYVSGKSPVNPQWFISHEVENIFKIKSKLFQIINLTSGIGMLIYYTCF